MVTDENLPTVRHYVDSNGRWVTEVSEDAAGGKYPMRIVAENGDGDVIFDEVVYGPPRSRDELTDAEIKREMVRTFDEIKSMDPARGEAVESYFRRMRVDK